MPTRRLYLVLCFLFLVVTVIDSSLVGQTPDVADLKQSEDSQPSIGDLNVADIKQNAEASQEANFDEDFIKRYVDYRYLVEDRLDVGSYNHKTLSDLLSRFDKKSIQSQAILSLFKELLSSRSIPNETLTLLNNGQYSEAELKAKIFIKKYLNHELHSSNPPWDDKEPVERSKNTAPMFKYSVNICVYAQLLGLAYELSGDYFNADKCYEIVYGSNELARAWTRSRLGYKQKDSMQRGTFTEICGIIRRYYKLTPEDVDSVVEKIKTTERQWKENPNTDIMIDCGVPVGLNEGQLRDVDAVELYRIRDWCARFICPNLVYSKLKFSPDSFGQYIVTPDDLGQYRIETVKLTRECYAQFMNAMEEEYEKIRLDLSEQSNLPASRFRPPTINDDFTDVMTLLRKIKELPY